MPVSFMPDLAATPASAQGGRQRVVKRTWGLVVGLASAVGTVGQTQAVELPKWEFGAGVATASVPDYRGSNERRQFTLPTPYLIYRGDTFKADREGARAQLFGVNNVHLDFYVGGSLPVSSSRNEARAGMPGLRGALDVGPALDIRLSETPDDRVLYKIRVPVSYGIGLGSPRKYLGWQTSPALHMYVRDTLGQAGWNTNFQTGPVFASRQRNAYYYDVDAAYATADRPAYRSDGGYAGWRFGASVGKRFERMWVGAFARYDSLQGAAFADSPLVRTKQYAMGGVALIWVLGESSERVSVD